MRVRFFLASLLLLSACGSDPDDVTAVDASIPIPDAPVMIPDAGPPDARPVRLSETSLYKDFATREIDPALIPFTPKYVLWSDGAEKKRWLRLPPGKSIDKSDPDHWKFPVGTQLFKEFSRNGVQLETRLIEKYGEGSMDFWMGSFVWLDDGSDAVYQMNGAQDIRGTDHDAPSSTFCWSCHGGEPGRILGYSAIQQEQGAPGDEVTSKALGYLHANCGHCHSDTGIARPDTDQILRLSVSEATPQMTRTWMTTVGKPLNYFRDDVAKLRIAPGDPAASGIIVRISTRGSSRQMPPLATEHTDMAGIATITAWIMSLPPASP